MVLNIFKHDRKYRPSEIISGYKIDKMLGEGRYGICYQVSRLGEPYILKQLKRGMQKKAGDKVRFEEEILKGLQHAAIPRFVERLELGGLLGYVLEYKQGRTFEDVLFLERHIFTPKEISMVGSQLIEILKYLHSEGIVHRDIRIPNTLYDGNKVSLVDFGLARRIDVQKYRADMDLAFLGDFLLHLYYSAFESKGRRKRPWHEELELGPEELIFFKRLMGIEQRYDNIHQVESEFLRVFAPS